MIFFDRYNDTTSYHNESRYTLMDEWHVYWMVLKTIYKIKYDIIRKERIRALFGGNDLPEDIYELIPDEEFRPLDMIKKYLEDYYFHEYNIIITEVDVHMTGGVTITYETHQGMYMWWDRRTCHIHYK